MGIKQFSTTLADFNQNQLDQIEINTLTIDTAVGRVETSVDAIKNTDLSNVSNRIGATTDASGTNTLFAFQKKLDANVNSVNTNVNGLKNNDIPAVKTQVDALRNTDVPNIQNNINQIPLSPIKSVLRGIALATFGGTTNITISAVNLAKSFINVYVTGYGSEGSSGKHLHGVRARLSSSTNLELYHQGLNYNSTASPVYVSWEVIEHV